MVISDSMAPLLLILRARGKQQKNDEGKEDEDGQLELESVEGKGRKERRTIVRRERKRERGN